MSDTASAVLDAALVQARGGDRDAFAVLVRAQQRAVYSLALRMLGRPDVAEDLAQEVFMQLYARLNSIESGGHLVFWLRKVTTHRAIDHLRQRARVETESLDDVAEVGADDEGDPLWQRQLRQLVLQLRPDARAVMTLRYQEDLDPTEIAALLDMPLNSVKSHLKRSLERLRQQLSGEACTKI